MLQSKPRVLVLLFLIVTLLLSSAYLFLPAHFQSLDSRIRDLYFQFRDRETPSDAIVIVDIDEKSIAALGQWPWERSKVATILDNLQSAQAGIIGLDIIFSEEDKSSPQKIAKEYHLNAEYLPDYDAILAKSVANSPTILGYVFDFDIENEKEAPTIPAIFIEKSKGLHEFIPEAKGALVNIEKIQKSSYSSGFMNNIPDEDGVVRSVPLFVRYDMELYPLLALELYRIAQGAKRVTLEYNKSGLQSLRVGQKEIAIDRFARLYLNFRGPTKSYHYISALDIFNNEFEKESIEGKYILVGTSAYGLMDLRTTPLDSVMPGVEIHANVLDNLLNADMLYKPSWVEAIDLLMIIVSSFIVLFLLSTLRLSLLISLFMLSLFALISFNYYMLFENSIILNSISPLASLFLSLLVALGVNYLFESRQKELIKGSFSKKVSKQVMDDLLLHPSSSALSSREVEATIYFSDIRSFTTISETLHSPKRITDFLNFYMNAMVLSVEKYRGTIDKFIGDAVMAYWNAPLEVKNHADKAVMTALEQIAMRDELNVTIQRDFGFDVDYGIGINTGEVVVGEIGSQGRSDYTIIGDAVNLASRLEGLCKPYKVRLIISEFTKEMLTQEYTTQLLDVVLVKGKHEPVKIYEVLAVGRPSQEKREELLRYEQAHSLYREAKFQEAKLLFEALYRDSKKYLYTLYSNRCDTLIENDVKEFDGVFEYTTK